MNFCPKKVIYFTGQSALEGRYVHCLQRKFWKNINRSAGGMFLTDNLEDVKKVKKWSTQSREDALWY